MKQRPLPASRWAWWLDAPRHFVWWRGVLIDPALAPYEANGQ